MEPTHGHAGPELGLPEAEAYLDALAAPIELLALPHRLMERLEERSRRNPITHVFQLVIRSDSDIASLLKTGYNAWRPIVTALADHGLRIDTRLSEAAVARIREEIHARREREQVLGLATAIYDFYLFESTRDLLEEHGIATMLDLFRLVRSQPFFRIKGLDACIEDIDDALAPHALAFMRAHDVPARVMEMARYRLGYALECE